jgi:hypothetical protein
LRGNSRGNKYNAVKVETPLGTADSRKEGKKLGELVAQVRADDRSITLKTVDRVRAFMATHDDASRAA